MARAAEVGLALAADVATYVVEVEGGEDVVEVLVVGVVEAEVLQTRVVAVCLGHEHKARLPLAHSCNRLFPELFLRSGESHERLLLSPVPLNHIVENEVCHVAPYAVALLRDGKELLRHCRPQLGIPIVQLQRVAPYVGPVAPVKDTVACHRIDTRGPRDCSIGLRLGLGSNVANVPQGVRQDPLAVYRGVVGHEIEQQAHARRLGRCLAPAAGAGRGSLAPADCHPTQAAAKGRQL
mmetsp:Transcript_4070/g.14381  ORF Transcript_4070/g.14381 Transcript_4070/m.14381 type:complete len:237 (+) Transcript_4070:578-1288(+)